MKKDFILIGVLTVIVTILMILLIKDLFLLPLYCILYYGLVGAIGLWLSIKMVIHLKNYDK